MYIAKALFLRSFKMTVSDAIFVAGPTSKKTSIAPGENPAANNAAPKGVEDVAHMYNGRPIITAPTYPPNRMS